MTKDEYEVALKRILELFDCEPDSPEAKELNTLFEVVEKYEDEHFHIEKPSREGMIEFCKDQGIPFKEEYML